MEIKKLSKNIIEDLTKVKTLDDLDSLRTKYLGRKGLVTGVLRSLKEMSDTKRKEIGKEANLFKMDVEKKISDKMQEMAGSLKSGNGAWIDVTRPGVVIEKGSLHPLTKIKNDVVDIFNSMGFTILDGPEVETEFYHFDALNIPKEHPARDLWDTFWLKTKAKLLLRAQTSSMQVRHMEHNNPPFRILVPGRCFRHEATDATHDMQFNQVEGLMVGQDVSLSNLKGVLNEFFKRFFGDSVEIRFRPSFFPFVEPGIEVDMRRDSQSKWMEIMGAGMVHPNVLKSAGYSEEDNWQGFAFGIGLDRIAMLKYQIEDIRLFYGGDLRFLKQF